ncbi:hypothetical protein PGIGA_G00195320 [Pangasianodon gigas]|uniref:Uncharacterized protein n=1 Tax=Pangasianodon gigas TaxID=30993 RepID=A0ACC5XWZ3_PANGG|nr:hypothetical protein [Pangasianodon gigas]
MFPNQKPCMTSEVQSLLKERNSAFRSGGKALYSAARASLRRGIKHAKDAYKRKIEDHLTDNNPRRVWQGIQSITNYKNNNHSTVYADASLAEERNHFFVSSIFKMIGEHKSTNLISCRDLEADCSVYISVWREREREREREQKTHTRAGGGGEVGVWFCAEEEKEQDEILSVEKLLSRS